MDKLNLVAFIIISLFTIQSCSNKSLYENNINFKNEQWNKDSTITFNFEINDTNQIFNIYFYTRINGKYSFSNIFLFADTKLPNNHILKDTIEYTLALPDGKWLGKGFGNIWSYKMPYRKYVKFPLKGTYTFSFTQAMRTETLNNILNAGIGIELANNIKDK